MCEILKGAKYERVSGVGYKVVVKHIATSKLFAMYARVPLPTGKRLRAKDYYYKRPIKPNLFTSRSKNNDPFSRVSYLPLDNPLSIGFHFFPDLLSAIRYKEHVHFSYPEGFRLGIVKVEYKTRVEAVQNDDTSYISKGITIPTPNLVRVTKNLTKKALGA